MGGGARFNDSSTSEVLARIEAMAEQYFLGVLDPRDDKPTLAMVRVHASLLAVTLVWPWWWAHGA
jgi:hypothetical protein